MIDLAKLEKLRRTESRITARCPACAATGGDKSGQHLVIFPTGKFGCAAHPKDTEHRREIFRLVGIEKPRDPDEERHHRRARVITERAELDRRKVSRALLAKRAAIITAHRWTESEALADSPENRPQMLCDPRQFIAALFPRDAVVWSGQTHQSGQGGRHANRWRTVADWQQEPEKNCGPMISPCTWPTGTTSRAAANVASAPFVVCDFDGFDGKPKTADAIAEHLAASMAIIRWMREALEWKLAAILHTGNVSLHAWFHRPAPAAVASLKHSAAALGIDAGLLESPEHPCRLPGWPHDKTGTASRVLWLQTNSNP